MIYEPQAYAIEDKPMVPFISEKEIEDILEGARPDREQVLKIIEKSLSKKRLSMQETAILVNATDPELVEEIKRVSTLFGQRIVRGDEVLATQKVRGACTTLEGRPTRFPPELLAGMQQYLAELS